MSDRQICPVCLEPTSKTDFHHWDYKRDIGVEVCRRCHQNIHGGNWTLGGSQRGVRVRQQGWWAEQWRERGGVKFESWKDIALLNMLYTHYAFAESDHYRERIDDLPEFYDYITTSFNLPEYLEERLPLINSLLLRYLEYTDVTDSDVDDHAIATARAANDVGMGAEWVAEELKNYQSEESP